MLEQIKKQSDIRIDNNNVSGCSEEEIANKYTEILNNTSISNKQQDQQIFDHATYCMDENNKINMKTTNQDIEKQYFEQYKKEDDKNRKKLIKQQQQWQIQIQNHQTNYDCSVETYMKKIKKVEGNSNEEIRLADEFTKYCVTK